MKPQFVIALYRTSSKKEQDPEHQQTAVATHFPQFKPDKVVWIDDETGDDKGRKIFVKEFLKEVQERVKNYQVIGLASTIERFTRNYRHLQDILNLHDYHGLKLYAIDGNLVTPSDRTLFALKVFIANEFLQSSRRAQRSGIRNALEKGRHTGGMPVGFVRTSEKGVYMIDPIKSEGIRIIFKKFSEGKASLKSFLPEAHRIGQMHGLRISSAERLRAILRNPFYKGFTRDIHTKELFVSRSPAIIDPYTWSEVNNVLDHRHMKKLKTHDLLYRGKIRTPFGKLLTGDPKKGRHGKGNYVYYTDKDKRVSSLKESQVDKAVAEFLTGAKDFLLKDHIRKAWQSVKKIFKTEQGDDQLKHKNQLRNIDERLDRLFEMRENGEITREQYADRKSKLSQQRQDLVSGYAEEDQQKFKAFLEIADLVFETLELASKSYLTASQEKKAAVLKLSVRNMEWTGEKLLIEPSKVLSAMVNFDDFNKWCTLLDEIRQFPLYELVGFLSATKTLHYSLITP